jgi:hypothetical protein
MRFFVARAMRAHHHNTELRFAPDTGGEAQFSLTRRFRRVSGSARPQARAPLQPSRPPRAKPPAPASASPASAAAPSIA